MQDQVAQLKDIGIPSTFLNSSISLAEQSALMRKAVDGQYRLLYLSPERLAREDTLDWIGRLDRAFFVIDEAHCISEWGHEFRPEYRQLRVLRERFPTTAIAAFTASATLQVRRDILKQLDLRDADKVIVSFHRPNLRYLVRRCDAKTQGSYLLAALRSHEGENVIIYAPTIARVGETVDLLAQEGIAVIAYHGQMDPQSRRLNQERWMSDEVKVIVGTIAFGLGINKPSVRAVIHLSLPKSLEQYYQEAGRAGRDGLPADCALLWQGKDVGLLAHFTDEISDPAERQRSWQRYHTIKKFVESDECRHQQICRHFGESPSWSTCEACDVCSPLPAWVDEGAKAIPGKGQRPRRARAGEDSPLVDHLKEWRRTVARDSGLPAFVILHDVTLEAIAEQQPTTLAALRQIEGIGERKLELYGPPILDALRAYAAGDRWKSRSASVANPREETLRLLAEGHSLQRIAEIRGRTLQTVVGTVAELIEDGEVEMKADWVAQEHHELIEQAINTIGGTRLRAWKDALPEDVTYEEVRLVLAAVRRRQGSQNGR
jgi:ATP-dependent DNA helicase RecQ